MNQKFKKIIISFLLVTLIVVALFFVMFITSILRPKTPTTNLTTNFLSDKIYTFEVSPDDHILGDFNAPVTLVIFSDLACPYSAEYFSTYTKLLAEAKYKQQVKIVWRHLPLDSAGFESRPLSLAAECAGEQSKFWQYVEQIFTHQADLGQKNIIEALAVNSNLTLNQFNNCLKDSTWFTDLVEANYQEGLAKDIQGTPTTFINGRPIEGALSLDQLKALVDQVMMFQ